MPADPAHLIRSALAHGNAWHAFELALAAAKGAGEEVLMLHRHLPPAEQLALALQAADEALEGLAVGLAWKEEGGGAKGREG